MIRPAHQSELVLVAVWKRALGGTLSVRERLKLLEAIEASIRGPVTAEAIAAIEPACPVFEQIVAEATRAASPKDGGEPFFAILECPQVFENLQRLNPSIGRAIALCG